MSMNRRVVLLVLLLGLLLPGTPVANKSLALAPGAETLATLRQTEIPIRNPVDLARRLLKLTAIPTVIPAKNYEVGDLEQFIAEDNDKAEQFTVTAQLWYKTAHVFMWFQQGYKPDLAAVKRAADKFEASIYPTVHEYFGTESSPGIDNDQHLYILHVRGLGGALLGYFSSSSEYPRVVMPDSNEHEMFFMNLDAFENSVGSSGYEGVLAHEFQHMVHHNLDTNEDGWLNEGLSVLSELLNGYPDLGFADAFLSMPDTQLNTWLPDVGANGSHYGAAFLFTTYFLQRFGEDALRALASNPANGLESVARTLQSIKATDPVTNKPVTIEDLFADWVMANLLDNPKVGDGRYAYPRIDSALRAPQMRTITVTPTVQSLLVTQWGTQYLDIAKQGHYKFSLQCDSTVNVVPTDPHSGHWMWWSNRSDFSNMRLTRAFDLTGVSKATLSFWLWHAIEKDWDYSYVEVSTDDGATWEALATQSSTPAGGHSNPYGPAYTGYSGGSEERDAVWQQETADLTPYAGKKVSIRFEYLTDDVVNEGGMVIDDIFESGNDGWIAEGWARIDNVLPQSYVVQMAEFGPTPRVFRLLGPDQGSSHTWTIDVGGDVSHLTIAISGFTQYTTEQAFCEYQLTAADK
jgi:immune inhibitor A